MVQNPNSQLDSFDSGKASCDDNGGASMEAAQVRLVEIDKVAMVSLAEVAAAAVCAVLVESAVVGASVANLALAQARAMYCCDGGRHRGTASRMGLDIKCGVLV